MTTERVTLSGADPALDVTHHLSDPLPVTLLRIDVIYLAGVMKRAVDHEEGILASWFDAPSRDPKRIESQRWRAGQRRRLYEQLAAVAGPMFDPDYPEKMREQSRKDAPAIAQAELSIPARNVDDTAT
jgi:hypothetical protein